MPVILYEVRDHIAFITINRPEVMNALNREAWEGLAHAWERVRDDPEVRSAIVTGAGDKAFSAGADLKEMARLDAETGQGEATSRRWSDALTAVEVWKPIIAAINGYCLAGGMEFALMCDFRIAAEHATFALTEVTIGGIPGTGGAQRLVRLVPFTHALELLMVGDRISAQEAFRIGLVNQVVPQSQLMPRAEALARRLNRNAPLSVQAVKEAAYRGLEMSLPQGLRMEGLLLEKLQHTEDNREGPRAFVEKRPPVFKGR
ncbi:MAG: enoyl-CoA hydratase/isomerase family protein [Chloroflexi bacterium]|nr:enoyl-CoA hydratase/isomerase family protein [Chloroflexota bacterium]